MRRRGGQIWLHAALLAILGLTLLPFAFVLNNSLRTNSEMNHSFFGWPKAAVAGAEYTRERLSGRTEGFKVAASTEKGAAVRRVGYWEAMRVVASQLGQGYAYAWEVLRPYTLNTIFVCLVTVIGVVLVGTVSGYVFSRCRFRGRETLFLAVLGFMMIPGVLTLVPSFMWVKQLGLLNSHWVLILPYIAGGQIFAIFLFKGFFDGLPGELFESARMDGAGHFTLYWRLVLPLSKSVIAVVAIVNILGTWNNFLWPFITNSDAKYHVVASGLFLMGQSNLSANYATMFAAYMLASIPLLVLFLYATKPFMAGVTSGAFKA
ncbi:MAG: carbohydrate ABC transporter permease [Fimbriimonadaceae bacterium]|nr:carbohydrate ABC transporter permease [Fimbriimonadaceae bacterium]